MKTPKDPRHLQRIKIMQELFTGGFGQNTEISSETSRKILSHQQELDEIIAKAAPTWPVEKINRIDLAILRLAVYELIVEAKNPAKVIVDEAVEIAKQYGGESSPPFVNGVLGKVIEEKHILV